MPRFTLHRPAPSASAPSFEAQPIPEGLRKDSRVQIHGELANMVLIECPQRVAEEWLAKMPGWVLKPETKVSIPDPRPKLRKGPK